MASSRRAPARGRSWWLAIGLVAVVELLGHAVVRARVVTEADLSPAIARVRANLRPTDLVVVAPRWADPLLRAGLGDMLTPAQLGPGNDLARFERLWVVSMRGHRAPEEPARGHSTLERFGRVTLRRHDLGPSPVLYDFLDHLPQASVERIDGDQRLPCAWSTDAPLGRGGLGQGAMWPRQRFVCPGASPWVFVGETIVEDLDLRPRRCAWQHPTENGPVRTRFPNVPLGRAIVLEAGLYYEHERMREHPPFHVRVYVGNDEVGHLVHRDGDGWKRLVASTAVHGAPPRATADVTIEVEAAAPHLRTACWAATTRRTMPEELAAR